MLPVLPVDAVLVAVLPVEPVLEVVLVAVLPAEPVPDVAPVSVVPAVPVVEVALVAVVPAPEVEAALEAVLPAPEVVVALEAVVVVAPPPAVDVVVAPVVPLAAGGVLHAASVETSNTERRRLVMQQPRHKRAHRCRPDGLSSTLSAAASEDPRVPSPLRPLLLLPLLLAQACAALQPERRLAPADQPLRVKRLLVMPVLFPYRACPDDIDKRARKDEVGTALTEDVMKNLAARGYTVVPASLAARSAEPKPPHLRDLAQRLCDGGTLAELPPSVLEQARAQGKAAQADQVLITGLARLRWHLKQNLGEDNGSVGEQANEFDVRAAASLVDLATARVVWSEYVDTRLYTGTYEDAVHRVLLFDQLRTRDPHEKLFYDFPLHEGAPAPK